MRESIGYRVSLGLLCALLLAGCAGEPATLAERAESPSATVESTAISPEKAAPAEATQESQSLDAVLVELEQMAAPEGIEADVFAELKEALAQALAERFGASDVDAGGKLASTPPMDDRSVPALSWSAVDDVLSWRYFSTGDYNQDGFVTINDLTQLGQNYLAEAPIDLSLALSCVDGNGDGLITINDITQIGQNFGDNVVAYHVYMSSNSSHYPVDAEDDNGNATYIDEITFIGADEPEDERKLFRLAVDEAIEGQYCWVRPADKDGNEGIASGMFKVPLNAAPHADVTANPVEGNSPLTVTFYASTSQDLDGEIVDYSWDWDGEENGWEWESTGAVSSAQHIYEFGAEYTPVLRVTDDEGDTGEAEIDLNVVGWWHTVLVTTTPGTWGLDMCRVNGKPAIAYQCYEVDTTEEAYISYVRASDELGLEWGAPQEISNRYVDPFLVDDNPIDLLETAEHPALFWELNNWDSGHKPQLQCGADPDGDTWQPEQTIRNFLNWPYGYTSGVINGNPAFGYEDKVGDEDEYRLSVALDPSGANWNDVLVLPAPASMRYGFVLKADGNPAICFKPNGGLVHLGWVRAQDAQGDSWGEPVTLFDEYVAHVSPCMVNNVPMVAAGKPLVDNFTWLKRARDYHGTSWHDAVKVPLDPGEGASVKGIYLREIQGKPAVGHLSQMNMAIYSLYYISATNAEGTEWSEQELIATGDGWMRASLEEIYGCPAFAYTIKASEGTEIYYTIKY